MILLALSKRASGRGTIPAVLAGAAPRRLLPPARGKSSPWTRELLWCRSCSSNQQSAASSYNKSANDRRSNAVKIAARVTERNSWPTWIEHPPSSLMRFFRTKFPDIPSTERLDAECPVQAVDWKLLKQDTNRLSVTWIGHSTCLLQMEGFTILTDPVFSDRCSPTQWFGPKRYRDPACTVQELLENLYDNNGDNNDPKNGSDQHQQLPPLVVAISHNHYDHLDYNSVKELSSRASAMKVPLLFVVPLGIKDWLRRNVPTLSSDIDNNQTVVELDWHESHSIFANSNCMHADPDDATNSPPPNRLDVTAVPMQHWSNRIGLDKDKTLWCGYSLKIHSNHSCTSSALFPGDTGWFEGLNDIGKEHGPYDVALVPIGAYEPNWFMKPQHTNPTDALNMARAIRASKALPIHWGTFQLTSEPCLEPIRRLKREMETNQPNSSQGIFECWNIGETVVVH